MSAAEQIQLQVDRSLEPKLEVLLAKKDSSNCSEIQTVQKRATLQVQFSNLQHQRALCKKGDSTMRTFR